MPYDLKMMYFDWIMKTVGNTFNGRSFNRLLTTLNKIPFTYTNVLDENRARDGVNFRYRFGYENDIFSEDIQLFLDDRPCSVLEMMSALAFRCEESIMSDDNYGDRTKDWFWAMIKSLGLLDMDDDNFNSRKVNEIIQIFLSKSYQKNGSGGLFTTTNNSVDMRRKDIWYQMMEYLNELDK